MSQPREPWYESDSERRWWWALGGRTVGLIVLCCIIAIALALGAWAWTYYTAGVRGKVKQNEIVNNGTNRVEQQEHFETLLGDIKGYTLQIRNVAQAVATDTDPELKSHDQTVLLGLKNTCASAVQQYDADAHKVSAAPWQSADVPYQIDTLDPTTNCREAS